MIWSYYAAQKLILQLVFVAIAVGFCRNGSASRLVYYISERRKVNHVTLFVLDLQILSNSEIDDILKNDPTHHACRAEYKQLKDEFEGYKRKLRNNKVSKDDHVSEDINDYKTKIEKLQTDIKNMEEHFEEKEKESISLITKLQIDITCTKENYELQLESLREDHKKNIEQLDTEIHKQRIRTVDLLQEKDTELERLQKIVFDREDLVQTQSIKQRCSVNDSFLTSDLSFIQDEPCSVEEMLVQSPTVSFDHLIV